MLNMMLLVITASLLSSASAAEPAPNKFALVCEWHVGTREGSETFHVDLITNRVNGHKAIINENSIYFIVGSTEHTIDRTSGVLVKAELGASLNRVELARPINRCSKTTSQKF